MSILKKIDNYMSIQEKKENISMYLCNEVSLDDAIELYKKSKNKKKTMSKFPKKIRNQIETLIDGGIL